MPILRFLLILMLVPFAIWLQAAVVLDLWFWFVVPLGAVPLASLWHSAGLVILQRLVCTRIGGARDPKATALVLQTAAILWALLAWGLGAWFHHGMAQ